MGTSIHIYNVNVSVKQKWQNSIVLLFHLRQETHEGEFFFTSKINRSDTFLAKIMTIFLPLFSEKRSITHKINRSGRVLNKHLHCQPNFGFDPLVNELQQRCVCCLTSKVFCFAFELPFLRFVAWDWTRGNLGPSFLKSFKQILWNAL